MRHLALFLLLAAAPVLADSEARDGADWVRITARPCTNEAVLAQLQGNERLDYRQASAEFGGKPFAACWRPDGDGVFLIYEDGDKGVILRRQLRPVLEA